MKETHSLIGTEQTFSIKSDLIDLDFYKFDFGSFIEIIQLWLLYDLLYDLQNFLQHTCIIVSQFLPALL